MSPTKVYSTTAIFATRQSESRGARRIFAEEVVSMMAARAITTIRRLRRPTHAGIVVMALAAIIMTVTPK